MLKKSNIKTTRKMLQAFNNISKLKAENPKMKLPEWYTRYSTDRTKDLSRSVGFRNGIVDDNAAFEFENKGSINLDDGFGASSTNDYAELRAKFNKDTSLLNLNRDSYPGGHTVTKQPQLIQQNENKMTLDQKRQFDKEIIRLAKVHGVVDNVVFGKDAKNKDILGKGFIKVLEKKHSTPYELDLKTLSKTPRPKGYSLDELFSSSNGTKTSKPNSQSIKKYLEEYLGDDKLDALNSYNQESLSPKRESKETPLNLDVLLKENQNKVLLEKNKQPIPIKSKQQMIDEEIKRISTSGRHDFSKNQALFQQIKSDAVQKSNPDDYKFIFKGQADNTRSMYPTDMPKKNDSINPIFFTPDYSVAEYYAESGLNGNLQLTGDGHKFLNYPVVGKRINGWENNPFIKPNGKPFDLQEPDNLKELKEKFPGLPKEDKEQAQLKIDRLQKDHDNQIKSYKGYMESSGLKTDHSTEKELKMPFTYMTGINTRKHSITSEDLDLYAKHEGKPDPAKYTPFFQTQESLDKLKTLEGVKENLDTYKGFKTNSEQRAKNGLNSQIETQSEILSNTIKTHPFDKPHGETVRTSQDLDPLRPDVMIKQIPGQDEYQVTKYPYKKNNNQLAYTKSEIDEDGDIFSPSRTKKQMLQSDYIKMQTIDKLQQFPQPKSYYEHKQRLFEKKNKGIQFPQPKSYYDQIDKEYKWHYDEIEQKKQEEANRIDQTRQERIKRRIERKKEMEDLRNIGKNYDSNTKTANLYFKYMSKEAKQIADMVSETLEKRATSERLLQYLAKNPEFIEEVANDSKIIKVTNKNKKSPAFLMFHKDVKQADGPMSNPNFKNVLGVFSTKPHPEAERQYVNKNPFNIIEGLIHDNFVNPNSFYSQYIHPKINPKEIIGTEKQTDLLSISPTLKKTKFVKTKSGLLLPESVSPGQGLFYTGANNLAKTENVNLLSSDSHVSEAAKKSWMQRRDRHGFNVDIDREAKQGERPLATIRNLKYQVNKILDTNAFDKKIIEEFDTPLEAIKYMKDKANPGGQVEFNPVRFQYGNADYSRNFFNDLD